MSGVDGEQIRSNPGIYPPGHLFESTYQIEKLLGEGATSVVYQAFHNLLQKHVAVKILKTERVINPETLQRFKQEAIALSKLQCPQILKVYAYGESVDGAPFIVSELVEGADLRSLFTEKFRLSPLLVCSIFHDLALGLQAAHEADIVHRDLKPENIMLGFSESGEPLVKIVDFGLAKVYVDSLDRQALTAGGALLGTPKYMSPEQCTGKSLDARSDIFALGTLMYEALAGRCPFEGTTALEVLSKISLDKADSFQNLTPAVVVPKKLEKLIFACLEKAPQARIQTAMQLACELKALKSELETKSVGGRGKIVLSNKAIVPAAIAIFCLGLAALFLTDNQRERSLEQEEYILKTKNSKAPRLSVLMNKNEQAKRLKDDHLLFAKQLETALARDHADLATKASAYEILARCAIGSSEYKKAEQFYEKALESNEKKWGKVSRQRSMTAGIYASFLCDRGELEKAEKLACSANEYFNNHEHAFDDNYWTIAALDRVYYLQGRYAEGLELRKKMISARPADLKDELAFVDDLLKAARDSLALGRKYEASAFCKQALASAVKSHKLAREQKISMLGYLASILIRAGDEKNLSSELIEEQKRIIDDFRGLAPLYAADLKRRLACEEAYIAYWRGERQKAQRLIARSIHDIKVASPETQIYTLEEAADLFALMNDREMALSLYEETIRAIKRCKIWDIAIPFKVYKKMAEISLKQNQEEAALVYLKAGLESCPYGYAGKDLVLVKQKIADLSKRN